MLEAEDRARQVFDHAFITANTNGFEAFIEDLRATSWGDHYGSAWTGSCGPRRRS